VQDRVCGYTSRGPNLDMTHTCNVNSFNMDVLYDRTPMFGNRWRFSYESNLFASCQGATLYKGAGQELTYSANLCPAGGFASPPVELTPSAGIFDRLIWYGANWLWMEKVTHRTYRYDKVTGMDYYHLTSITDPSGNAVTLSYSADETMLTSIVDASGRGANFMYNGMNRQVWRVYSPDGKTAKYEYDDAGNLISSEDHLGNKTQYNYDAYGNLAVVRDPLGYLESYYFEDKVKLPAKSDAQGRGTWFTYDKNRRLTKILLQDAYEYKQMEENRPDSILSVRSPWQYGHGDGLSGKRVGFLRYLPYGQLANKTGSIANPFTFVGAYEVMDEGDGLYFMKNRYYDANTRRFLQKDPIGFAGGLNLYQYASGNPANLIDPEGTWVWVLPVSAATYLAYKVGSAAWNAWHGAECSATTASEGLKSRDKISEDIKSGKYRDDVDGLFERIRKNEATTRIGLNDAAEKLAKGSTIVQPSPVN
jgi:RHS repeat-associated protein